VIVSKIREADEDKYFKNIKINDRMKNQIIIENTNKRYRPYIISEALVKEYPAPNYISANL
jgi:hypothetical protein